jgi:magnesium transporter
MANVIPGSAPGLRPENFEDVGPTDETVTVIAYDPEQLTETVMPLHDVQRPEPTDTRVVWIRFRGMPEPAGLARFGARWGLDPLDLEDVVNLGQRPKTEFRDDTVFAILQTPTIAQDEPVANRQVNLFCGPNFVISILDDGPLLYDPVLARIRSGGPTSRIRSLGAAYLFYALLDATVDYAFPVLDRLEHSAESIEAELLEDAHSVSLDVLHGLRRDLTVLRRFQRPTGDALRRLVKHEDSPINEEVAEFVGDTIDHQAQLDDALDAMREDAMSLQELYLSLQGHRLNDVMKVLTIISTIFIPMSFLTGLYGMNFDPDASPWNMPELDADYGYPTLLFILAGIAVAMLVFFRRKRWI